MTDHARKKGIFVTYVLWLLDEHPWIFTAVLFWTLFAVAEAGWRIAGAVQAWQLQRFCRRETRAMQRYHEEAARRTQAVQSLAEWNVRR